MIAAQSLSFTETAHLKCLDPELSLYVKTHYWWVMDEAFFHSVQLKQTINEEACAAQIILCIVSLPSIFCMKGLVFHSWGQY